MLVLGMDPGSLRFGVGLIERRGRELRFVHSQTLRLSGRDLVDRLRQLWRGLDEILDRFPADEAAMEEGFLGKNVHAQAVLAMVRGLASAALIARGGGLAYYAPRQVKQALTGNGGADKLQVQRMVCRLLGVGERGSLDESDALAVACCHAMSRP